MPSRHFCIAAALLVATTAAAFAQTPPGAGVTGSPITLADALGNLWGLSVVSDGAGGWRLSVLTSSTPTATASSGIAPVISTAAESSHVLKSAAGNLYDVYADATAAGNLVVINAVAPPASGATITPIECVPVPAGGSNGVAFSSVPEVFSVGITALYTTGGCFTYTPSATAFIHGRVK